MVWDFRKGVVLCFIVFDACILMTSAGILSGSLGDTLSSKEALHGVGSFAYVRRLLLIWSFLSGQQRCEKFGKSTDEDFIWVVVI